MNSESPPPQGEPDVASAGGDRELDFHPGMEMRWEITRNTADTGGELFEATNWLDPGMAGPPVHVHPTAEDSFEVIEGALDFCVDGKWRTPEPANRPRRLRAFRTRCGRGTVSLCARSTSTGRRCSSSPSFARCRG